MKKSESSRDAPLTQDAIDVEYFDAVRTMLTTEDCDILNNRLLKRLRRVAAVYTLLGAAGVVG